MAIYKLKQLLNQYGNDYLVLDYNHLFVSDSIREEVWLLRGKDDAKVIGEIIQAAREFNIHDASGDRAFYTYSGGQQAILGCLLVLTAIRAGKIQGRKLLLNNILNSISEENQLKLHRWFGRVRDTHAVRFFMTDNGRIEEIYS